MTHRGPRTARDLWQLLEPIHAVTYFCPEPLAALKEAGYRGFWMGYFAGRAAPLGAASPEVVHALFYNFTFDHVARALPDAWTFAPPEAALAARERGAVAALRRHLGAASTSPAVTRAAELAGAAAASAPMEGRALFAANRALAEPDEPLARLWHAATLLREHRGDAHIAALLTAGIGGRESHVLHALSAGTPPEVYAVARNMDAQEWQRLLDGLHDRGLADETGVLTDLGREVTRSVEERTDELAWTAFEALDQAELDELLATLRPLAAAVVAANEIPVKSPMGLDLSAAAAPSARAAEPDGR